MFAQKEDQEIEKAIKFLVTRAQEAGRNPKPVVLHSLRVALYLYNQNYTKNIIIAAILHDILEDTATDLLEIEKNFGTEISALISANSFNETIKDKVLQYQDLFARCLEVGQGALIIKAADILDNSQYYHLAADKAEKQLLIGKLKSFLDSSKNIINQEKVWQDLQKQYLILTK